MSVIERVVLGSDVGPSRGDVRLTRWVTSGCQWLTELGGATGRGPNAAV